MIIERTTYRMHVRIPKTSFYNGAGVVKTHFWLFEPGAGSRAGRRFSADRSSQTLDAADGSRYFRADEERPKGGFVPISISLRRLAKAHFLESYGETSFTNHLSDLQPQTMIRFSNSPPVGEAERSIILPMELAPPGNSSGYPACELAALG